MLRVSINIVNWNGVEDVIECIDSLKKVTYPTNEIIVIDNASYGEDVKILRKRYSGDIIIIENNKNYGFVGGTLIGIKESMAKKFDYCLLLSHDVVVEPKFLDSLIDVAEKHKNIAILSAMVYDYYKPDLIQLGPVTVHKSGTLELNTKIKYNERGYHDTLLIYPQCMLMSIEIIKKLELLKVMKDYFLYCDVLPSLQALKHGYKLAYVQDSKIWHKGSRVLRKAGAVKTKWIIKDNLLLRYRFLRSGYLRCIPFSIYLSYFIWLYIDRVIDSIVSILKGDIKLNHLSLVGLAELFRARV